MLEDHKEIVIPNLRRWPKKLGSTLKLLQWKTENCVTDQGFEKLLKIMKNRLPMGNQLHARTYEPKKGCLPLGLDVQKINACINDCILYYGEYDNLDAYSVCIVLQYKI
jgi:hypothetical protein